MSEKDKSSIEYSPTVNSENGETASNQLDKLSSKFEKSAELSPRDSEKRAEKARNEALENAISVESGSKEKDTNASQVAPVRRGSINKKQLDASYKQTMKLVQSELKPTGRLFSRIVHSKYIEESSEVIGSTIARPNAILTGGIFAFILTTLTYVIAKNFGYKLSGFETIAAFIAGWLIGIVYDYFKLLVTGKKS